MLPVIVALGSAFQCHKSLTITKNEPVRVNMYMKEGKIFCINSTLKYLTAVFPQTNLLSVRYFVQNDKYKLVPYGATVMPGKHGGIDFGDTFGSLEIKVLASGPLNLTLFAFPSNCSNLRYITSLDPDEFTLKSRFGASKNLAIGKPLCIWHTERNYMFKRGIRVKSLQSYDNVMKCNATRCEHVFGAEDHIMTNGQWLVVTPPSKEFISDFVFNIKPKRARATLKVSEVLLPNPEVTLIPITDAFFSIVSELEREANEHDSVRDYREYMEQMDQPEQEQDQDQDQDPEPVKQQISKHNNEVREHDTAVVYGGVVLASVVVICFIFAALGIVVSCMNGKPRRVVTVDEQHPLMPGVRYVHPQFVNPMYRGVTLQQYIYQMPMPSMYAPTAGVNPASV